MRVLHTAGWHLGRKLGRIDRGADLRRAVEAVLGYCEAEAVDLLLIAGDLFDSDCARTTSAPRSTTCKEAARPFLRDGGTILAATGNHDGETFCKTLQHTLALADPAAMTPGGRRAPRRFHPMTRPALHRLTDRAGRDVQIVLMPYPTASRYLDDAATPYRGGLEGKNRRLRRAFSETLGRIHGHSSFDVNGGGKVQRGAAAEMGDTLDLTHCSLPKMEADRPTFEGTGCIQTWKTGPRSAVASSPTASAGAPPAASTRSTGRPSRRYSTTPSRRAIAAPSPSAPRPWTRSCRSSIRSSGTTRRPPGSSGTPPDGSPTGSGPSTAIRAA